MFVDILTPKTPLEADKLLRHCRQGEAEITEEICFNVLRSTNHAACIKRMLLCVERLPKEKQAAFKEAVLAVFHNREQPESVQEIGLRLAAAHGYAGDFCALLAFVDNGIGKYIRSAPEVSVYTVFNDKTYRTGAPEKYERVMVNDAFLLAEGKSSFPPYMDLTHCKHVQIQNSDTAQIKEMTFGEGGFAFFYNVKNLPEKLEIKKGGKLSVSQCDLRGVKGLKLGEMSEFYAGNNVRLPEDLDVSGCRFFYAGYCDLSEVKGLKFKSGAAVLFNGETLVLPENLDVSACEKAEFCLCDLGGFEELKFNDGGEVIFKRIERLPKKIDVSRCGKVLFEKCSFAGVEEIKFSGREQKIKSMAFVIDKGVRVVFADEAAADNGKQTAEEEKVSTNGVAAVSKRGTEVPAGGTAVLCPKADNGEEVARFRARFKNCGR